MNGDANCGYALQQIKSEDSMTKDEKTWMIIAIVFIICFVIILVILIVLLYKIKQNPDQRGKFNKVTDADDHEPINTH